MMSIQLFVNYFVTWLIKRLKNKLGPREALYGALLLFSKWWFLWGTLHFF